MAEGRPWRGSLTLVLLVLVFVSCRKLSGAASPFPTSWFYCWGEGQSWEPRFAAARFCISAAEEWQEIWARVGRFWQM